VKILEPNLLLAVTTSLALVLLIATASLFGEPGQTLKYIILPLICVPALMGCNALLARRKGRSPIPMISTDAPDTVAFSAIYPGITMLCAAIPVVFSGHDYGLLIIIASVLCAITVESAIRAVRTP